MIRLQWDDVSDAVHRTQLLVDNSRHLTNNQLGIDMSIVLLACKSLFDESPRSVIVGQSTLTIDESSDQEVLQQRVFRKLVTVVIDLVAVGGIDSATSALLELLKSCWNDKVSFLVPYILTV